MAQYTAYIEVDEDHVGDDDQPVTKEQVVEMLEDEIEDASGVWDAEVVLAP